MRYYYDNVVHELAEKFIDAMFGSLFAFPCWLRRTILLTFPISLPIWLLIILISMLIYLLLMFVSFIVNVWKCEH